MSTDLAIPQPLFILEVNGSGSGLCLKVNDLVCIDHFFCTHTLCVNYRTEAFLLVSSSGGLEQVLGPKKSNRKLTYNKQLCSLT